MSEVRHEPPESPQSASLVRVLTLVLAAVAVVLGVAAVVLSLDDEGAEVADDGPTAPPSTAAPASAPTAQPTAAATAASAVAESTSESSPSTEATAGSRGAPGGPPAELVALTEDGRAVVLSTADGGELRELDRLADPTQSPPDEGPPPNFLFDVTRSPDGSTVYESDCCEPAVGNVFSVPFGGGAERTPVTNGAAVSIAPDGSRLALNVLTGLAVYDVATGATTEVLGSDSAPSPQSTSWSPDGTRIAFAGFAEAGDPEGTSSIGIVAAGADATPTRLDPPAGRTWVQPVWRADGELVFVDQEADGDGRAVGTVADPDDGSVLAQFPLDGQVVDLDYDASGRWLLVVLADGTVRYEGGGVQGIIGQDVLAASW